MGVTSNNKWHSFGMPILEEKSGETKLCRLFGTVYDEEFSELTSEGLPPGWVAWHEGSCDVEMLKGRPVVYADYVDLLSQHKAQKVAARELLMRREARLKLELLAVNF